MALEQPFSNEAMHARFTKNDQQYRTKTDKAVQFAEAREEARALIAAIDTTSLTGLRDRALIRLMIYTFAPSVRCSR